MSENSATAAATAAYFKSRQVHPDKIRTLDGLTVSAIAVGTYLGANDETADRLYEDALVRAARDGINFFDTAVNYRCQRSERNVAYALRKLAGSGIPREQIVVSTKGGFLPAEGSPENFQEYVYKCYLNTGIVSPEDIVANCHCMTPKYLASQIELSLANLKCGAIDLYYLHNPETQLRHVGEEEFYRRVTAAFALFEEKAAEGKIKRYGVATWNGLRQGRGAEDLIDLEKLVACAKSAGGAGHRFKAVQLPYNLAMLEAVAIPNQAGEDGDLPAIAAAVRHGLSVLVSAPLLQSQVAHLPREFYDKMPGSGTPMQKALEFVTSSPGVVSAMTGMKTREHVDENVRVLSRKNWEVNELQDVARLLVKA